MRQLAESLGEHQGDQRVAQLASAGWSVARSESVTTIAVLAYSWQYRGTVDSDEERDGRRSPAAHRGGRRAGGPGPRDRDARSWPPRAAAAEAAGEFPRDAFRLLGEAGVLGLPYPEEYGGSGAAVRGLPAGAGGDRRRLDDASGWASRCTSWPRTRWPRYGTPDQRATFLPEMLGGEQLGAYALSEAQAGSDISGMTTRAKRAAEGFDLSGAKAWITHGGHADFYTTFARSGPEGDGDLLLPRARPGARAELRGAGAQDGADRLADHRALLRRGASRRRPADRRRGPGPPDRPVGAGLRAARHRRLRHRAGPGRAGSGGRLRARSGSSSAGRSRSSRGCSSCWPRWPRRSTRRGPAT